MTLDMTGHHRYTPEVHYRRYLSKDPQAGIIAVCVQNFDYIDYDPARFVDLTAFPTPTAAYTAPITTRDITEQMNLLDEDDNEGRFQARRILWAISREALVRSINSPH